MDGNDFLNPTNLIELAMLEKADGGGGQNGLGGEGLLEAPPKALGPGKVSPEYLYQGLLKRGLSPTAAIATLGNWEQESSFNSGALNSKEGAIGLDQWRLGRADSLRKLAQATGRAVTDPDLQMDYYVQELHNHPGGQALLGASNLVSANDALKTFIGYGDDSQGTRLANAENLAKSLRASGVEVGQDSSPAKAEELAGSPAVAGATLSASTSSGASGGGNRDLLKLMLLASLGNVRLQPVDYDPFKLQPDFGA